MKALFWICWTLDLLLLIMTVLGALLRSSWSLSNPFTSIHFWALLLSLVAVAGGLLTRFAWKMPRVSLVLVVLPLLVGFGYYLIDSRRPGGG